MIEIHIKLTIKKPQKAKSIVWRLDDLLKGIWSFLLRTNWTYVFVFTKCIYWLHVYINQYIPYLTT